MKLVQQTRFGEEGNCFQACVATMLGMELGSVPDFCNLEDGYWYDKFFLFLSQFGLSCVMYDLRMVADTEFFDEIKDAATLVIGHTAQHITRRHCCVYWGGSVLHNPLQGCDLTDEEYVIYIGWRHNMSSYKCEDNTACHISDGTETTIDYRNFGEPIFQALSLRRIQDIVKIAIKTND